MYLAEYVEIIVEDEPKKDKVLAKCYFISFFLYCTETQMNKVSDLYH